LNIRPNTNAVFNRTTFIVYIKNTEKYRKKSLNFDTVSISKGRAGVGKEGAKGA
jgi:hypothetical protein